MTFDFAPKIFALVRPSADSSDTTANVDRVALMVKGLTSVRLIFGASNASLFFSFEGNTVTWYSIDVECFQFNERNKTYGYVAIG